MTPSMLPQAWRRGTGDPEACQKARAMNRIPSDCRTTQALRNPTPRQNATASGQRSSVSMVTRVALSPLELPSAAATRARPIPQRRDSGRTSSQGIENRGDPDPGPEGVDSSSRITPARPVCGLCSAGTDPKTFSGSITAPQPCTTRPGRLVSSARNPSGRSPHALATAAAIARDRSSPQARELTSKGATPAAGTLAGWRAHSATSIAIRTTPMTES